MLSLDPVDFETLNALAAHGDDKSAIRDVIHYVSFIDEAEARAFAAAVLGIGFHDVALGQPNASEGDESFVVRAHHEGTLILEDIGERLSSIRKLAASFSGVHEGWEAALTLES